MAPVVVKKCQLLGIRLSSLFQQLSENDLCLLEPSLRAEPLRILTACNHPHHSGKWNSQLPKIYISGIHEQDGTELSGIKIETESTIFLATIYKVIHRLEEVGPGEGHLGGQGWPHGKPQAADTRSSFPAETLDPDRGGATATGPTDLEPAAHQQRPQPHRTAASYRPSCQHR